MVLQVWWVLQRSENGSGLVADRGIGERGKGFGGVFEAARANRTALAGCGKAGLSGGYYGVGGVQLGFFG